MESFKRWGWIILLLILSTACSPEAPKSELQVSDETCKPESISGIKDKVVQQRIASACIRRGEFNASEKKSW